MKYSVIKHNKNGRYRRTYDGYLDHHWLNVLDKQCEYTDNHEDADFSILPIVWEPEYEYDEKLNKIKFNNIVMLDFLEFGCGTWPDPRYYTSHSIFGYKFDMYDGFMNREVQYKSLHDNINLHLSEHVSVYFKRELSKLLDMTDISVPVLPVDFINTFNSYEPVTENEFWERGLDLLYIWGRSSQDRVKMYAKIFGEMDRYGHNMYSSEKQYEEGVIKDKRDSGILLLHKEWFERCNFMKYQSNSRCVIDLYGAGMKCFRTIESTINSISFKQDLSNLKHAYDWIDGENCIFLKNHNESNVLDVNESSNIIHHYIRGNGKDDLYQIYLKSCDINLKYRNDTYLSNYFIPNIIDNLK